MRHSKRTYSGGLWDTRTPLPHTSWFALLWVHTNHQPLKECQVREVQLTPLILPETLTRGNTATPLGLWAHVCSTFTWLNLPQIQEVGSHDQKTPSNQTAPLQSSPFLLQFLSFVLIEFTHFKGKIHVIVCISLLRPLWQNATGWAS